MVYFTIRRYFPQYTDDEDVHQIARIALWQSCLSYDKTKGAMFSTYAIRSIQFNLLRYIRDKHADMRSGSVISLSDYLTDDETIDIEDTLGQTDDGEYFSDTLDGMLWYIFGNRLSKRQNKIVRWLYDGLTQSDIADRLGLSQPQIHRDIKKIQTIYQKGS